jgi:quercetin dioxygenase-like cupin family protein
MAQPPVRNDEQRAVVPVPAGEDQFGERRSLGINTVTFKVTPSDYPDQLIVENTFHAKGGPPRHLHHDQDEWFYILEGSFAMEIGDERFLLKPGDSILAPREVPHAWAFIDGTLGRLLISFLPAGKMEAFFREVSTVHGRPPREPEVWRAHGMELLGPPLPVD